MLNRALVLATVMLLIGCFAAAPARAQNLEAGKSPSQIFAGTCTVCHKSPRGLLKTISAGALPGFLRQHYTTSPEMAGLLSSYLVSNGAADKRYQGKDAKSDGKPAGQPGGAPPQLDRQGRPVHTSAPAREPAKPEAEQQPAAKPDTAAISPQDDGARKGRRRLARPAEEGAKPAEDETAVRNVGEPGPDGRKLGAKQRLSKRGKPGEEMPKGDAKNDAKNDAKGDAAKADSGNEAPAASTAAREDKPAGEATKDEGAKDGGAKSSDKPSDETAKVEETAPKAPAGQTPVLRADPVPAVTPAPAASAAAAAASGGATEPAAPAAASAARPAQSAASEPASAAAAASAPSSAPAGPPQPPISR
jgi:hypothetical protein